jgi:hypothetical protein
MNLKLTYYLQSWLYIKSLFVEDFE